MNIVIKKAGLEQLSHIVSIENASFSVPWSENSLKTEMEDENSHFTVAQVDGVTAGFLILHTFADEGEIYNVAVKQQLRGNGIGDALLTEALKYAAGSRILKVFLEVRESNTPARKLYEKHGFKNLSIRKGYYDKPIEDCINMEWSAEKKQPKAYFGGLE